MAKRYVEIYSGETLIDTLASVSKYSVAENYALIAYVDGTASETTVNSGGRMEVSGGTATATVIKNGGTMTVNSGNVSNVSLRAGGTLNLNGAASDITLLTGGNINVYAGGVGSDVGVYSINAVITVYADGLLQDVSRNYGTITLSGGNAEDVVMYNGTLSVGSGSLADKIVLFQEGCSVSVLSGGSLNNSTCDGGEITVKSGAVASNTVVTGYKAEGLETKEVIGKMTLESGAVHTGTLSITDYGSVIAESGSRIDFTISDCTPGCAALIDNFAGITGTPGYTLTVSSSQQSGVYVLAEKVNSFTGTISVFDTDNRSLGNVSLASALVTSSYSYTLSLAGQTLSLTVACAQEQPYNLTGNAAGVTWQSTANDFTVQYSKDDFASVLELQTASCGVDTYALPAAGYDWRVKNTSGSSWSEGNAIVSGYVPSGAAAWQSDNDDVGDLFFANASGTWTAKYVAEHLGSIGDWSGTNEQVRLTGKNRIADTFTGSDDANILVLTDDANGDALFVDDIYTAFPDNTQSRIAQLDEIRAGAGDDVVDMTSQRFEYQGDGITIRGGSGNDTVWANKGSNMLFGDAGNDRLVGASGNDVLAGGIGNDTMHGGGGSDVFCFCDNWGQDTVEELSGGSVTLWFKTGSAAKWDQTTMTYTDGDNSVKVTGVSSVTLKFGDDESLLYDELTAAGCFLSETSEKIFETEAKGTLASL